MTITYVLGFAFSPEPAARCVLIERHKDDWQRGRVNGLGGHIKPGEIPTDAMIREFSEESGIETVASDWMEMLTIHGNGWIMHVFRGALTGQERLNEQCKEGAVFWAETPPTNMDRTALWLYWLCRDYGCFGFSVNFMWKREEQGNLVGEL